MGKSRCGAGTTAVVAYGTTMRSSKFFAPGVSDDFRFALHAVMMAAKSTYDERNIAGFQNSHLISASLTAILIEEYRLAQFRIPAPVYKRFFMLCFILIFVGIYGLGITCCFSPHILAGSHERWLQFQIMSRGHCLKWRISQSTNRHRGDAFALWEPFREAACKALVPSIIAMLRYSFRRRW